MGCDIPADNILLIGAFLCVTGKVSLVYMIAGCRQYSECYVWRMWWGFCQVLVRPFFYDIPDSGVNWYSLGG